MRGFPATLSCFSPYAHRPSQGKRALRRGPAPLQASRRENRPPHRASRARVLREADRRAQAQARCGGEAPLQAHARPDAPAEALLKAPGSTHLQRRARHPARLAAVISGVHMPLRDQVNEDMKSAMKAREPDKLAAIRLLLAAMKQREVDERITLDDAGVVGVVE